MKPYMWRTRNSSYVYVDSMTGDDLGGDGTMGNPYRTLGRAYRGSSTAPGTIVCRGRFCEDMADGNHSTKITGDYMGAAVFDGEDVFLIYGFGHENMMIENCAEATYDLGVQAGSWANAGVGRSQTLGWVGHPSYMAGITGGSVIVGKSPLYCGCICGHTGAENVAVWSPKVSGTAKLYYGSGASNRHWSVCDVRTDRLRLTPPGRNQVFTASLFAKCDFVANDPITFEECLFGADCRWITAAGEEVELGSASGQSRLDALLGALAELGIPEAKRPKFVNCEFSGQGAPELFNNAEAGDLTLRPGSDAVRTGRRYYGALAPALNVPIMDDSTGVAGSWDEQSANGILQVSGGAICIDETSSDTAGEIVSKVVRIDTSKMWITAVLAKYGEKWSSEGVHLSAGSVLGAEYAPGAALPQGRYVARGSIIYKGTVWADGSVVGVTEDGTTFTTDAAEGGSAGAALVAIDDPNIANVCYIRSTPAIFALVSSTDGLQRGGVYYNYATKNIQYRGRTVAPGESFVAANDTDRFTPPPDMARYQIGVMFDDTRVPSQEWIPAQFFGEYFVYKVNGVIQLDAGGRPISSGNELSYQGSADGGYADVLRKSVMSERYCQFKIIASKE